ncbi:MAG: hypothetical protein GY757_45820 [bacterium]|nr:hypothetical protein [bacterium]
MKKITGLLLILLLSLSLTAAERLHFKGEYFLFSDALDYIYGGGNIQLKSKGVSLTGNVLYMDAKGLSGIIYGDVKVTTTGKNSQHAPPLLPEGLSGFQGELSLGPPGGPPEGSQRAAGGTAYDAVFFKGIPTRLLLVSFGESLTFSGDASLVADFKSFVKLAPDMLKDTHLYFEFREFRIDKKGKIKAKIVVPYMMGMPTVPLKSFTVNRGQWAEKTMLAFDNVNYSGLDGLSISFFLRLKEKFIAGDYSIKLYERKLFKLDGAKRGVLFSGKSSLRFKKKELLNVSLLLNSGEQSYNLRLTHRKDFKYFSYSFSQDISGREKIPAFFEFSSDVTVKKLKFIVPKFRFAHDWKKSYTYRLSTPLKLWKKLNLGVSWQRKLISDSYRSDTSDLETNLGFSTKLFSMTSNYNYSRNLVEASVRKNFSVNMKLKPLHFLWGNVTVDMATFYMLSELPFEGGAQTRITPGMNIGIRSAGAGLPFGFRLVPGFTFNRMWDNREENFTDFNYALALQKDIGAFTGSLEYSLAARYRAENFWIEGNNRQNLNLNFGYNMTKGKRGNDSLLLRFYFNNSMIVENISLTGKLSFPYDFVFSSFLLYYNEDKKFRTMEVFIEKTFKKKIKLQGGYSLALKRFFIEFLVI